MNSAAAKPTATPAPRLRPATRRDADAIAALHAQSWRATYRGMLSDAYLDSAIEGERRAAWRERLAPGAADTPIVILAETDARLVGFVCIIADADPRFGALIDNLHVAASHKRSGIAKRLLAEGLAHLTPAQRRQPVHLLVFAGNEAAGTVYERLGGKQADRFAEIEPDGTEVDVIRYVWPDAAGLLHRLSRASRSLQA